MVRIFIHTDRDQPLDRDQIMQQLLSISPDQDVVIDMKSEGPSIEHIGLRQILDDWVDTTGRNKSSVKIHTPNQIEKTHYEFYQELYLSHCFKRPFVNFHKDFCKLDQSVKLFGVFLGNFTVDRKEIIQTILNKYQNQSLISIMGHQRMNLPPQWSWPPEVYNIGSIDNVWIKHRYDGSCNIIQSLLNHYHKFQIELVAETFTRGKTFFPTEKTVRPIMGSKPLLIFGPRDFLKNLQQIGFQTFDKLWSEAYDNYEGDERWTQMQLVMDGIVSTGYDIEVAQQITEHNYYRLQEIIKDVK